MNIRKTDRASTLGESSSALSARRLDAQAPGREPSEGADARRSSDAKPATSENTTTHCPAINCVELASSGASHRTWFREGWVAVTAAVHMLRLGMRTNALYPGPAGAASVRRATVHSTAQSVRPSLRDSVNAQCLQCESSMSGANVNLAATETLALTKKNHTIWTSL